MEKNASEATKRKDFATLVVVRLIVCGWNGADGRSAHKLVEKVLKVVNATYSPPSHAMELIVLEIIKSPNLATKNVVQLIASLQAGKRGEDATPVAEEGFKRESGSWKDLRCVEEWSAMKRWRNRAFATHNAVLWIAGLQIGEFGMTALPLAARTVFQYVIDLSRHLPNVEDRSVEI